MTTILAAWRSALARRRVTAAAVVLRLHPMGAREGGKDRQSNGGEGRGTKAHNGIVTELGSRN